MTPAQALPSITAALAMASRSAREKGLRLLPRVHVEQVEPAVAVLSVLENHRGVRVSITPREQGPADAGCVFCSTYLCRHVTAGLFALKDHLEAAAAREAVVHRARTANSLRELLDVARDAGASRLLTMHVSELVSNAPGVPLSLRSTALSELSAAGYRQLAPDVQRTLFAEVRRRLEAHTATAAPADPYDELLAWAKAERVDALLDQPIHPITFGEPARPKLRELARLPDSSHRRQLFAQAKSFLEVAVRMRRAAEQERDLPGYARPLRPDGVLGELFDSLGAAREQLLAERTVPQQQFNARLSIALDPLQLVVVFVSATTRQPDADVVIHLEGWRKSLRLACSRCRRSSCHHFPLAVEQARLALGQLMPDVRERFETALSQPAWKRALELAPALPAPSARSRDTVLFVLATQGDFVVDLALHARGPKSRSPVGRQLSKHLERSELPLGREDEAAFEWWRVSKQVERGYYRSNRLDSDELFFRALEALIGHPRVVDEAGRPLDVRRAVPTLRVRETEAGFTLSCEAGGTGLEGPDLEKATALLVTGPRRSAAVVGGKCLLLEMPDELFLWLSALKRFGTAFPPEAGPALAERLEALESRLTLDLPPTLAGERRESDARPALALALRTDGGLELVVGVRPLEGGATFPAGEGPARVYVTAGARRAFTVRDFDAELRARSELLAKLGVPDRGEVGVAPERAVDVVTALDALGDAAHVEWAGKALVRTRSAQPSDVKLALRKRRDWFGVEGRVSVDGVDVALDELLAAVRAGRRHLRVGVDRSLTLSEELRSRLRTLAALASVGGSELGSGALPVFEELTQGFGEVEAPPEWRALSKRLSEARAERVAVPAGLKATLRDYQQRGFEWLASLGAWGAGACLADDMGLGKTLQALAVLLHRAALGPALVIAPTSVCGNWLAEAERFAPGLDVKLHHGGGRDRALEELRAGQVLVTSYGVLTRDVELLEKCRLATLVLDEAHALKNASTARAQATRRLQADFRLALTGTPLENRLGELWSLFRVVQPGVLGSEEWFREQFVRPIEGAGDADARGALARIIRPFVLRRLKREVAAELPARTDTTVRVEAPARERARYEEERRLAVAELDEVDLSDGPAARLHVLAALTRLRQLACHPKLVDSDWSHGSAKLEHVLELTDALRAEGHKVLVFSQFVRLLDLVRPALEERGGRVLQLDGSTSQAERDRRVQAFQRGEADVFLLSLKAGGVGLNLTAATYVVHLDPWWNPAVEDQATDRAHRIGQTQPVTVYRLVTAGTVEEQILQLHAEKRALVEGVLDGTGAAGAMSTEELLRLVRGEALELATRSGARG